MLLLFGVQNVRISWIFNAKLIALLAITLPLTVSTKFIPTGDMSFDEGKFQLKTRAFLKSERVELSTASSPFISYQRIEFTYKSCNSAVVVLPPSDNWAALLTKRTPVGHIVKFRYKDYLGDEQPNYRATFNEFYQILLYPISNENRRQPLLALIATPSCMDTLQTIAWEKYWTV